MAYTAALQANSQHVVLERVPAAADSDTATQQTVQLMCRYISAAANDPVVQDAANYCKNTFAGGDHPAMLAWGVFWFAKHNCKFVVDEAPLARFERTTPGSGLGQQDMLISPDVLLRMAPWERRGDCDDFTMLCCALLKALGVPFVIVTICADPQEPSRWSHVFCMALTPSAIPIDASHGNGPGWMVPAAHTFKWQGWDEQGSPVNVERPSSGLHGWVPSEYGLGQTVDFPDVSLPDTYMSPSADTTAADILQGGTAAAEVGLLDSSSAAGPSSFNWTSFLNNLTGQAAGVAKVAELSSAGVTASMGVSNMFSSLMPIILIVVVGGIAINALGSRK